MSASSTDRYGPAHLRWARAASSSMMACAGSDRGSGQRGEACRPLVAHYAVARGTAPPAALRAERRCWSTRPPPPASAVWAPLNHADAAFDMGVVSFAVPAVPAAKRPRADPDSRTRLVGALRRSSASRAGRRCIATPSTKAATSPKVCQARSTTRARPHFVPGVAGGWRWPRHC